MKRRLPKFLTLLLTVVGMAFSASAADQVTFTPHSFDQGYVIYRTYSVSDEKLELASKVEFPDRSNEGIYEFVLFNGNVEPQYSFSIKVPEMYDHIQPLRFVQDDDNYICEILVTQHLFNDDDLYEVVLRGREDDGDYYKETYGIFNENGEFLGECPGYKLCIINDEEHIYAESDKRVETPDGVEFYNVSVLYSINKGGASVVNMKAETAKMVVNPNPVKSGETVTLTLPDALTKDTQIKVFSINGSLLVEKACEAGEQSVTVPANSLSTGVNPVVAIDKEGNVLYSGKIIRE